MAKLILRPIGAAAALAAAVAAGAMPASLPAPAAQARQVEDRAACRAASARPTARPVLLVRIGRRLVVLARHAGGAPTLIGPLSGALARVGGAGDRWCSVFAIDDLDHAILDVVITADMQVIGHAEYRGPALAPLPKGPFRAGRIERRSFHGEASGLTRTLSFYQPRAAPRRLVFILDVSGPDNMLFHRVDRLIASGAIAPVALVGIAPAEAADWRLASAMRLGEMQRGDDPASYRRFEQFIFADLLPVVARELGLAGQPGRVAFVGASAGAAWVLDHASGHGGEARAWAAFALPNRRGDPLPGAASGAIFMGGGTLDRDYLANGERVCAAISQGGGQCRFAIVHAGHSQSGWDELAMDMLRRWAGRD